MKKMICFLFALILCIGGVSAGAETPQLNINAKSALLMEQSTGNVLYESNADEPLPIASVTKIMTMLLIMEEIDAGRLKLDDIVTASERAESMGGSTMFLEVGEQMTVHDMLRGIAVASANDGCVAMAEHIAGSEEAFVAMMNKKAEELGMLNTQFINTNGLDADGHFSSARDVALMSRELLTHEKIFDYTTIWTDTMRDGKFALANTNKLIRFYPGANGLKTGSTSQAGCCISASAERDGMQLIAVVLGAPNSTERFESAKALLNYGFASYGITSIVSEGDPAGEYPVMNGVQDTVSAMCSESFTQLTAKGGGGEFTTETIINENLKAPINAGDVIGRIDISSEGQVIGSVDITACENVEKKTWSDIFMGMLSYILFR